MIRTLNILAILFILIGIIAFAVSLSGVKDSKYYRDFWQDAAKKNRTNELIQAEANMYNEAYVSKITTSIVSLFSGIVTGIFFLSISKIISILENIHRTINEQNNKLVVNSPILKQEMASDGLDV